MTFAVCVTFTLHEGLHKDFLPRVVENARLSLEREQHCHRFDVLSDPDRPSDVFLYEIYENAQAFQHHLETAHFQSFDAATRDMIIDKTVKTYKDVAS